jgi:hypothetical protein
VSQTPIVSSAEVNIRRAPKYLHFALTGLVLGIVAALVLGQSLPAIVGLLVVFGGIAGGGTGIILALVFDAIYRSRSKKLMATKVNE